MPGLSQPDRLRLEANSKARRNRIDDPVAQCHDFSGARSPTVDERKRVAAGDSRIAQRVAFAKARPLNQPRSGDLYLAVLGRIGRNALLFDAQLLRHSIELR